MQILQITSPYVCGPHRVGQWFCAESAHGSDGHSVTRYLQADGSWDKNAHYFDSENAVNQSLAIDNKPDFSLSRDELMSRQMLRDWTEHDDDYLFDDPLPD